MDPSRLIPGQEIRCAFEDLAFKALHVNLHKMYVFDILLSKHIIKTMHREGCTNLITRSHWFKRILTTFSDPIAHIVNARNDLTFVLLGSQTHVE